MNHTPGRKVDMLAYVEKTESEIVGDTVAADSCPCRLSARGGRQASGQQSSSPACRKACNEEHQGVDDGNLLASASVHNYAFIIFFNGRARLALYFIKLENFAVLMQSSCEITACHENFIYN